MRIFSSGCVGLTPPDWYWRRGLHDALIVRCEFVTLEYDYRDPAPLRNCLRLTLDASDALYDTGIQQIEFYNCKVLLDETNIGGYLPGSVSDCYWMQDQLRRERGKFILELILLGEDDFRYSISFDTAKVYRT